MVDCTSAWLSYPSARQATSMRFGRALAAWVEHGLFDDLVRSNKNGLRDSEAQPLGGLEVDNEEKSGRLLDGKIAGFGAFQDLIHVLRGVSVFVGHAGTKAHQTSCLGEFGVTGNDRHGVLCRQIKYHGLERGDECIVENDEGLC